MPSTNKPASFDLHSRRTGPSATLKGYKNPSRATCYIAAFITSLLHVPTFLNVSWDAWKAGCGCRPDETCFSCDLAGQVAVSGEGDPQTKGRHRLEWLFKHLPELLPDSVQAKRNRTVDLTKSDRVRRVSLTASPAAACMLPVY